MRSSAPSRHRSCNIATIAIAVLLLVDAALAAEETLQNDSFATTDAVTFQAGFVANEIAAARFVPTISCPCVLKHVTLLFGGATDTRDIGLLVWDDAAGAAAPGAPLFSGDVTLTGSNEALQVIDLTLTSIVVDGPFRVGIGLHQPGLPSVATDTDGTIDAGANFILADIGALFWFPATTLGVSGDFILRATVDNLVGSDLDADGVADDADNCSTVANADQRDTDADQYGNRCDPDIAPSVNDCLVNFADLAAVKNAFFAAPPDANWNADADFDGDDRVNFSDLVIMQRFFFGPPGPSGLVDDCP